MHYLWGSVEEPKATSFLSDNLALLSTAAVVCVGALFWCCRRPKKQQVKDAPHTSAVATRAIARDLTKPVVGKSQMPPKPQAKGKPNKGSTAQGSASSRTELQAAHREVRAGVPTHHLTAAAATAAAGTALTAVFREAVDRAKQPHQKVSEVVKIAEKALEELVFGKGVNANDQVSEFHRLNNSQNCERSIHLAVTSELRGLAAHEPACSAHVADWVSYYNACLQIATQTSEALQKQFPVSAESETWVTQTVAKVWKLYDLYTPIEQQTKAIQLAFQCAVLKKQDCFV